ncbi:MAG: MerR family transcriptional regulator [Acidimicrobiia bacterium]|nr:MerR family transcriptional regulator [Acidimicrobiia bacterium]
MSDASDVSDQRRRSIGDVLALLEDEFPDISISKIRYLESQGLVSPSRAESGYRQFDDDDVALLRWVLRQQRDHFLPLRVIRDKLLAGDLDDQTSTAAPASRRPSPAAIDTTVSLDADELARAAGLDPTQVEELESYRLLEPIRVGRTVRYDGSALLMARLAARFAELGMEARHLRMYKVAADREAGVLAQLMAPLVGSDEADDRLRELVDLGGDVRALLLRRELHGDQ